MPGNGRWGWAVAVLLVLTGWGIVRLFDLSTGGGQAFPAYSTLRSDPMGAKVFHDALAILPGYKAERSFKPLAQFRPPAQAAVFILGAPVTGGLLADCRKWAARGSRIIVVFEPRSSAAQEPASRKNSEIEREWKIRFEPLPADRRWTAFSPEDESWNVLRHDGEDATIVETRFGAGSIVLVGEVLPLSNEGLSKAAYAGLLLELLSGRRHVIFEESHLGVTQSGSVGQLLRRYRLGGAALALLSLAALFFWRSSTSFLPPPSPTANRPAAAVDADGEDALVHLVRGSIPASQLLGSARILWNRGSSAMLTPGAERRARAGAALENTAGAKPLDAWNRAHQILKRNSTS